MIVVVELKALPLEELLKVKSILLGLLGKISKIKLFKPFS